MSPYAGATSHSRYGGTFLIDDREVAQTAQCCHCGDHFLISKKTAKGRGWCFRCNAFICGAKCVDCIPFDVRLLIMEGKLIETALPVTVAVPRDVTG